MKPVPLWLIIWRLLWFGITLPPRFVWLVSRDLYTVILPVLWHKMKKDID